MNSRCIAALFTMTFFIVIPALALAPSDDMNAAGSLYSQSVDLANAGKYNEALVAADKALAMNVSSLIPLIQSNRAGILVMLDRNSEALDAADAALNIQGDLTSVHSIAWYNKGNALRNLGRIDEAKDAYTKAQALDKTLTPPDLSHDIPVVATSGAVSLTIPATAGPVNSPSGAGTPVMATTKSPISLLVITISLALVAGFFVSRKEKQ